jgi:hypothetical protein
MPVSRNLSAATFAFAIIFGASAGFAAPLTEQEFIDSHAGRCVTYSGPTDGTQCYDADGATRYDDESYGTDTGTWAFANGRVCSSWSKESGAACDAVSVNDDGSFSGSSGYSWRINE